MLLMKMRATFFALLVLRPRPLEIELGVAQRLRVDVLQPVMTALLFYLRGTKDGKRVDERRVISAVEYSSVS